MSLHEQGFDFLFILASKEFAISYSSGNIGGGIKISVCLMTTDHTTKRLLVRPVLPVRIIAHTACL